MKTLIVLTLLFSTSIYAKTKRSKSYCIPVSEGKFTSVLNKIKLSPARYKKVLSSRKINVKKGQSIKSYVLRDKYNYDSVASGVELFKKINNLKGSTFKKSQKISLPFCLVSKSNNERRKKLKRKIAAIGRTKVVKKKQVKESDKKLDFSLSTQYGNLTLESSTEDFQMNFLKASGNIKYQFNKKYFFTSSLSVVQFQGIEHSLTDKTLDSSGVYPEFGAAIHRRFGNLSIGLGYDLLQYFTRDTDAVGVSLAPSAIHRASAKVSYQLTSKLSFLANAGFVKGFEESDINGFDTSIGANYAFDNAQKFSITPVFYKSFVERDSGELSDESTAFALSFSYKF